MFTGKVRKMSVLGVFIALGGCISPGSYTASDPLVSASELDAMIKVTVTSLEPVPDDGVAVAALDQERTPAESP